MRFLAAAQLFLLVLGEALVQHPIALDRAWGILLEMGLELAVHFEDLPAARALDRQGVASVQVSSGHC